MSECMEVDPLDASEETGHDDKEKSKETNCDVVILDDDDVECELIDLVKADTSVSTKCINYACKSGQNMLEPPGFCLSFYRIKNKMNKKQQVCLECYDQAIEHYEDLACAAIVGKPLMEVDVPFRNDVVEIDDSDPDSENEQEAVDEKTMQLLESDLDSTLISVLKKYNFEDQTKKSYDILRKATDTISDSFNEVKTMFQSIRRETDKMILDLSNNMRADNMELPALDISSRRVSSVRSTQSRSILTPQITSKTNNNTPGARSQKAVTPTKPNQTSALGNLRTNASKANTAISLSSGTSKLPPNPLQITSDINPLQTTDIGEDKSETISSITGDVVIIPADLPMIGNVVKHPLKVGETYYAYRFQLIGAWMRVRLVDIVPAGTKKNDHFYNQTMYEVVFEGRQKLGPKMVSGKEIAYSTPCPVQLEVGSRVIAIFREITAAGEIKKSKRDSFYPGIIAEPLQLANKYRYLIFFDDGYAQYVSHNHVHLIHESNKNVWEDVNINSRAFVKKYLENYGTRAMVRFLKDQTVRTEYNGKWWITTVINVDCSLVQVFFDDISRIEWIYRGSTRFSPMFEQEQAAANRQHKQRFTRKPNPSGPYVEYTRLDGTTTSAAIGEGQPGEQRQRSVARKSTSARPMQVSNASNIPPVLPNSDVDTPATKIVYYTPRRQKPKTNAFEAHNCNAACKEYLYCALSRMKGYSPLAKPLLCGFYRLLLKVKHKKIVAYRAPCGRTLRNMTEVHQYLQLTQSDLTVDLFDFNDYVRCLAEFMVEAKSIINKDLSQGKEECPITVVNYVDNKSLDFCNYSTKRQPIEGVRMNLDPDFMVCCDCTDDCSDRSKCSCWQLTLQCLNYMDKDTDPESVGYQYRRLPESIFSGIYECNSRCKCAATCLNRVVQNPMQHKLQIFKTDMRGWGIRCLNDIPQGSFICIYAGSLLTEEIANMDGKSYGDEYLAELDFIETAENYKEEYEDDPYHDELERDKMIKSEVEEEASMEDDDEDDEDDDMPFNERFGKEDDYDFVPCVFVPKPAPSGMQEESGIRTRLRRRITEAISKGDKKDKPEKPKVVKGVNDDDTVMISDDEDYAPRELSSFNPRDPEENGQKSKQLSVRKRFGQDESVYIMDAMSTGNIGRFLNHSCSPNIFVQNVFVDTHDPRFPWVAFFTMTYVKAGTELTWNYNYDIGSVPDKVLYCFCASNECKGRLL